MIVEQPGSLAAQSDRAVVIDMHVLPRHDTERVFLILICSVCFEKTAGYIFDTLDKHPAFLKWLN